MKNLLLLPLLFLAPRLAAQEPFRAREEARVSIQTDDGWKLNARYLPAAEGAPTVLLLHAQKLDLSEWGVWFPQLKRRGYGYLAVDLRGHGSSFVAPDGSTSSYKDFATGGANNEFNKMIRDVEASLAYLSTEGVSGDRTILVGSVLGANLAIKAAAIHQDIAMTAAFSPVLNVNDVLSVNPLRAYGKRPLLLVSGTNRAKQYKEFQLLNDIAKQSCGRDNVTTIVEAKGFGAGELVSRSGVRKFLNWFRNPRRPFVVERSTAPDSAEGAGDEGADGSAPAEETEEEETTAYE